ncbi:MAG: GNAT family N-acetyltransferase [Chryseobacterium sp.]
MKAQEIKIPELNIKLIEPDADRDAQFSTVFLKGELGKQTMLLMGVPEEQIQEISLESEKERIRSFIENTDSLNWMIQKDDRVVGSIWVDLKFNNEVPAPSTHLLIWDPVVRGKGVGEASMKSVIRFLKDKGYKVIYTRTKTDNIPIINLLKKIGFTAYGHEYIDEHGISWRNQSLEF